MTRSGHFNPVFKEALSESLSVFEGSASPDRWRVRRSPRACFLQSVTGTGVMGTPARGEPLCECVGHGVVPTVHPCAQPQVVCGTQWSLPLHPGRRSVKPVSVCAGVVALSGIEEGRVEGKHTRNDKEVSATVRAGNRARRVDVRWGGLPRGADCPCDPLPESVGSEGSVGVHHAAVSDLHDAIGQDRREAPAETLHGVEGGGAGACTAGLTGGAGNGAILEAHATAGGDGDRADRRGEVGAGRVAVGGGLAVRMPGGFPDQGVDGGQEISVVHLLCEDGAVEG